MNNWLRRKLRTWLFPECVDVADFMGEVREALKRKVDGKLIIADKPIVLLGSMSYCNVEVKPKLYPKIVLSQIGLEALLSVSGERNSVISSVFTGKEESVGLGLEEKEQ